MKIKYTIIMFCLLIGTAYSQAANILQKAFVHITGHDNQTLEIGNIIFNFESDQHVDLLKKSTQGDIETRAYFFPMAKASSDAKLKEIAVELNKQLSPQICSVTITEETKPILGIKIEFRYDTKVIDIMYNAFSAINLKKGIIFRIYNKVTLNQLQKKNDDQSLLMMALHTGTKTVVIDCGHGGDDDGAIGVDNIKEKDINLSIGKLVAKQLKKKGVNALLTRSQDVTLTLKDRILFANKAKANLFVSIHANAALNKAASGVETFGIVPLTVGSDFPSSSQNTQPFVQRLLQHRIDKSMDCATAIQNSLVAYIKNIHHEVKDRSVKRAPLLVLLGTAMPAALVEVGFVSNPEESRLLADQKYQEYLAHGITEGISNYLQSV